MVDFCRPDCRAPREGSELVERGFDFLGFTHYWARSRRGGWVVWKNTAATRFRRILRRIHLWCRAHRHWKVRDQHSVLTLMMRGHDGYFGVTGNWPSLARLRHAVLHIWRYWLNRRSQQHAVTWQRLLRWLQRDPFPSPRIYWTG